mmetsp:Transcript_26929/g.31326  ORF Transcript_26929/g.31326 Transcript_26929/m.31326 type:complete len:233 (+) Transcript_26929:151-849(+)
MLRTIKKIVNQRKIFSKRKDYVADSKQELISTNEITHNSLLLSDLQLPDNDELTNNSPPPSLAMARTLPTTPSTNCSTTSRLYYPEDNEIMATTKATNKTTSEETQSTDDTSGAVAFPVDDEMVMIEKSVFDVLILNEMVMKEKSVLDKFMRKVFSGEKYKKSIAMIMALCPQVSRENAERFSILSMAYTLDCLGLTESAIYIAKTVSGFEHLESNLSDLTSEQGIALTMLL